MTEPSQAVFLSYASQDAAVAARICDALRAAGIEVWFDQSELRGGDAWDQSIRKQIKTCALFLPIISKHTHDRAEGYFRLEWKLAVDRSHLIMSNKAFLVPVVIDGTSADDENVPERFREVQWMRLSPGATPSEFVRRIRQLLSGEVSTSATLRRGTSARVPRDSSRMRAAWLVVPAAIAAVATYLLVQKPWTAGSTASPPPAHSIAVLPFVNLSGDSSQEYFADGLTEELLNSLVAIDGLQVTARTSSFAFKEHPDIVTVAHKLNVASVLEGSIRRSGHTIRITAQLVNASTGLRVWSRTYDRDLRDVLKLQTEIATAVADTLKVKLLGDIAAKIELGGTRDPTAFDAYLRASRAFESRRGTKDLLGAIADYGEAIRLDPSYALAYVYRSFARTTYAAEAVSREDFEKAEADARKAIALAPELAEAHAALGYALESGPHDFAGAQEAYDHAIALAPGNAQVLRASAEFGSLMGHFDAAIVAARHAVVLDPLDRRSHSILGRALYAARRYGEAARAHADAIRVNPGYIAAYGEEGLALYGLGALDRARVSCETKRDDLVSQTCLAVVYSKLGRHADAEAELAKLKRVQGDAAAYQYATIYGQWGDPRRALGWLDTAMRLSDPGLESLKTDPLLDPLRKEPHFQAIERELKFPN